MVNLTLKFTIKLFKISNQIQISAQTLSNFYKAQSLELQIKTATNPFSNKESQPRNV